MFVEIINKTLCSFNKLLLNYRNIVSAIGNSYGVVGRNYPFTLRSIGLRPKCLQGPKPSDCGQ